MGCAWEGSLHLSTRDHLSKRGGWWERPRWDRDGTGDGTGDGTADGTRRRMRQLLGTNAQVLELARCPVMVHMLASMVDDRA